MEKVDYKKELKHLYGGKLGQYMLVDVPRMNFLMIDGRGDPNTSAEFAQAVGVLYPVAYTLKFTSKNELGQDYRVMPLEGQFWADDMSAFSADRKDEWLWTLMIMQPHTITKAMFETAVQKVQEKKNHPALDKLRFEEFHEGRAAQVLYMGPYSEETETIVALHEFIKEQGGKLDGDMSKKHHEIYLSDARRTASEKLKTMIRQPF